jgi:glycosyltransferase involved in cell wall biosynthesis
MTFVTIIIPVLNGEAYIARAVQSVLNQEFADLEIVIIDDGSTDRTSAIIAGFKDPRIRYEYQPRRGPSAARNAGISLSVSEWVAFLDADDHWHPRKLIAQVKAVHECPDVAIVYCAAQYCSPTGETLEIVPAAVEGNILPQLLVANCISGSASSAMVSRSALSRVGVFDEALTWGEDWDLWLRLCAEYEVKRISEPLVYITARPNSLGKQALAMRDDSLRLVRRVHARFRDVSTRALRRRALWYVYRSAASTQQERGEYLSALQNVLMAAWYRPSDWTLYWRALRILTRR